MIAQKVSQSIPNTTLRIAAIIAETVSVRPVSWLRSLKVIPAICGTFDVPNFWLWLCPHILAIEDYPQVAYTRGPNRAVPWNKTKVMRR
jgi:hypothetical protein